MLSAPITVPVGVTLTVGAGQVVKSNDVNSVITGTIIVNGTIRAMGTAASPVVFTSLNDDTAGNDTDNDNDNGRNPASPGSWHGLYFTATSLIINIRTKQLGIRILKYKSNPFMKKLCKSIFLHFFYIYPNILKIVFSIIRINYCGY